MPQRVRHPVRPGDCSDDFQVLDQWTLIARARPLEQVERRFGRRPVVAHACSDSFGERGACYRERAPKCPDRGAVQHFSGCMALAPAETLVISSAVSQGVREVRGER
jgi:hypothetical protein